MTVIVHSSSHRVPRLLRGRPFTVAPAGNDNAVPRLGLVNGPETGLVVTFVGLNETEQQRALGSFPGARRCTLVAS